MRQMTLRIWTGPYGTFNSIDNVVSLCPAHQSFIPPTPPHTHVHTKEVPVRYRYRHFCELYWLLDTLEMWECHAKTHIMSD